MAAAAARGGEMLDYTELLTAVGDRSAADTPDANFSKKQVEGPAAQRNEGDGGMAARVAPVELSGCTPRPAGGKQRPTKQRRPRRKHRHLGTLFSFKHAHLSCGAPVR